MPIQTSNIISITKARSQLGKLADSAVADNYFVLTKGSNPLVALVDFGYLQKLESMIESIFQKTYINPKLEKFTREFTNEEILQWQKEDQL